MTVQPIIVSYSELDTFRQCPLKHHILYGQRWTKPPKEDSALSKGSLYHKAMEEFARLVKQYQDEHNGKGPRPESAEWKMLERNVWAAIMPMLADPKTGEQSQVQALIQWMIEGFISKWGLFEDWRLLGIEHQIITPLRDANNRRSRYHLKAKIDLIARDRSTGARWVIDHKSGQNLPTQMDLEIDDQFGLYTWALNEVGKPVTGSVHMANRTQKNKSFMPLDTRMSLTYLNRDRIEVKNLALDAYWAARAAHPPKSGEQARYSSPDPRSCGWKCDIKEPHLLMRRGRKPAEVLTEYGFKIDRTRH